MGEERWNIDPQGRRTDAAWTTDHTLLVLTTSYPWCWGEEQLRFLPERALWHDARRILMVADLHLGKAESFQAQGIPCPSDDDKGTFNPLLDLCHQWEPNTLIILGDLIHSRLGLTPQLRDVLRHLPELCGCELVLIGGNHDRSCWIEGLPQHASQAVGRLWLSHAPETPRETGQLNICGHLHPSTRLRTRADSVRLPCFAFDPDGPRLVIPAFGELTGSHDCGERYRQWLIAEGSIVPWFDPHPKNRGRKAA